MTIKPAATVVLLRDSPSGPEVLLVRRHSKATFMAGAHVFPGGAVDEADGRLDGRWCDGVERATDGLAGVGPREALALRVAAARELFEEAGILLARAETGSLIQLSDEATSDRFKQYRHGLHTSTLNLEAILRQERLKLAVNGLTPFAHWVTPPSEPRRFDTRFFVARQPFDQQTVHDERETTESLWSRPLDAIDAAREGRLALPPPTWVSLREIEPFGTVEEVLEWASARTIERREPALIDHEGIRTIVLPGDPLHPATSAIGASTQIETRFVRTGDRWSPVAP